MFGTLPPSVCVLCAYEQRSVSPSTAQLPAGCVSCSEPGSSCTLDELAAEAHSTFMRLFPDCAFMRLKQRNAPATVLTSDAEAQNAGHFNSVSTEPDDLEAALEALGL